MRTLKALLFTLLIFLLIGLLSYLIAEYLAHKQFMEKLDRDTQRFKTKKQRVEQAEHERQQYYYNKKYTEQKKKTNTKRKTYTSKRHTPKKTYDKYSSSVKLKSDSRIILMEDNRLKSNAPIYGTFKGYLITNAKCPKKREHDINMYNECFVKNVNNDKFYFKKELVGEFNHRINNYGIVNCHYNKKFGIMQDCRI